MKVLTKPKGRQIYQNAAVNNWQQETAAYDLSNKDKPVKAIAQSLGIGCSTLENWVRKASGTVRRELRNDQQRIRQPKRENAHLKEVDNIIKKAHMYFMGKPRQWGTRARASG